MKELTKSEEIVMLAIWNLDEPIGLSSVMAKLEEDNNQKNWKPQTVSTFFGKLVNKGYLKLKRNGKIYTYDLLVSKEKYSKHLLKDMLTRFFDSDKQDMIDIINKL